MLTNNDNPCYSSGAIWITRREIYAYPEELLLNRKTNRRELEKKRIIIQYGSIVLLLSYFMSVDIESIVVLYNEKKYVCSNIDSAHDFQINPKGYNTKLKRRLNGL
jgi:hypothetical protein